MGDEEWSYANNVTNGNETEIVEDCASYLSSTNPMNSSYFHATVYVMYCGIFVVALTGNGMVCFIVRSSPRMRTVTNYFIVNLAVGDMLTTVFCGPFTFLSMLILHYWPFGECLCTVVNYAQAVSVFVSAYTLVAISVDRYMAIMWPLRPRISKKWALVIIAVVWLFAILTALPIPIKSRLMQPSSWHQTCDRSVCMEDWPSEEQNRYYSMALMILQYLVPLTVLLFTYTSIAVVVWCKRFPGEAEDSRDQRMARSKRKMIKMMVIVVIVFTICWLPFNVLMVMLNMNISPVHPKALPYVWFLLHWLALSHSCYNPIIYCYLNARFRSGFLQSMSSVPCCRNCLPPPKRSSMTALALTGAEVTESSLLQRVNTCTTYISLRRKQGIVGGNNHCPTYNYSVPVRSASMMRNNHIPQPRRASRISEENKI